VHGVDKDTLDVTDPAAVARFAEKIGPVDILVNNAGGVVGQVHHPVEEIRDEDWRAVVDANGFVLSNPTTEKQWESYGEEGQRQLVERIALRRLGTAQDIANGVKFFVSDDASWITGQVISIDGGHAIF
jgi:NAD(P)-dependent dehydrogenase (short-subunit alcohol dehydrogenase family)